MIVTNAINCIFVFNLNTGCGKYVMLHIMPGEKNLYLITYLSARPDWELTCLFLRRGSRFPARPYRQGVK